MQYVKDSKPAGHFVSHLKTRLLPQTSKPFFINRSPAAGVLTQIVNKCTGSRFVVDLVALVVVVGVSLAFPYGVKSLTRAKSLRIQPPKNCNVRHILPYCQQIYGILTSNETRNRLYR